MAAAKYTPSEIEPKWQAYWAEHNTFKTGNPGDPGFDTSKPKYYVLDMFPYPSGAGLHVGHPEGYTATDILARYKRMNGFNVLHPMGWDAFGLPAEQYAMQTGTHPATTTQKNIDNFRATLQRLGFSYDWTREVDTTDPKYYHWTQWIFLKLFNSIFDPRVNKARPVADVIKELDANLIGIFEESKLQFDLTGEQAQEAGLGKQWGELNADERWRVLANHRLAYVSDAPVWWCDALGTVLANEEVIDGKSERGDHPCVKKPLKQWMMRITAYSERLIADLDQVDWPESIKLQQRNWIGSSEGAEVDFEIVPPESNYVDGVNLKSILADRKHPFSSDEIAYVARSVISSLATNLERGIVHRDITPANIMISNSGLVKIIDLPNEANQNITQSGIIVGTPIYMSPEQGAGQTVDFRSDMYSLGCVLYEMVKGEPPFNASKVAAIIYKHMFELPPPLDAVDPLMEEFILKLLAKQPERRYQSPAEALSVLSQIRCDRATVESGLARRALSQSTVSKGKEVGQLKKLRVFTTRPDTLYGATYMVIAPEHPLVKEIVSDEQRAEVEKYVAAASGKSDLMRTDLAKDKSGVFSGAYAFNPVFDKSDPRAKIPIWVADYVLMGYGTGAIMAVPAHDERDAEFALKFGLPIVSVVMPPDKWLMENFQREELELEELPYFLEDSVVAEDEINQIFQRASQLSKQIQKKINANDPNEVRALIELLKEYFKANPISFKSFFTDDGHAFNSPAIEGLHTPDAKKKITTWLEEKGIGQKKTTFRLRDWLFSRQRYWGEPFPICWDEQGNARPLTVDSLPLMLPEMSDFKPTGTPEPPLSKATQWVHCRAEIQPDGSARIITPGSTTTAFANTVSVRRETNTMPQWAGSCWYYLRYMDNKNSSAPFSTEAEKYWMNVDLYVGGAEHAVLHLLYSRFWHKVLFDLGVVKDSEPYKRLFNQGLIQAFVFKDSTGRTIPNDEVEKLPDESYIQKSNAMKLMQEVGKMSKSLKNVIPADDVITEFGSDTLRLYEMFMGPLDGSKPWNPRDVPGMFRFLRDCWKLIVQDDEREAQAGNLRMNLLPSASELIGSGAPGVELEKQIHKTIKGVTQDIERMAFNTAISKLMVFKNNASKDVNQLTRFQAERFLVLLSPFAPHIAEELWSRMRHAGSIASQPWPKYDEALTQDATKELAIQVNGKIKARITVAADAAEDAVKELALKAVEADLVGKTIAKIMVVPGRLVNIAVK